MGAVKQASNEQGRPKDEKHKLLAGWSVQVLWALPGWLGCSGAQAAQEWGWGNG